MKPLAISLGDPAGIGPEIVAKALAELDVPAYVFGAKAWSPAIRAERFIDVGHEGELQPGKIDARHGRVALQSIHAAVDAIERGECSALVTAPIHKQAVALAGSEHPGHTELLAARANLPRYAHDYAMYFDSPRLKTVLLSVHVSLRRAVESIDAGDIAALARLTSREFDQLYGKRPRIAVAGVNPHAGEGGKFGVEEEEIARGVALAREALGDDVTGPHPPDTVFLAAMNGRYDVVMAMYHDQGLIPIKTVDFHHSVNVTLGLPYLRVSVDHGTAFDIAGLGVADAAPMRYAIEWAARFC
ncbi:MAG TPA: 4-hydroxythreonine-4-phosphate dehydrogenase PdxA [Thermoanaerobaculia bacterium]|jgi:4-hydroxythreonine-4-phosphate dehydrogenase